MPRVCLSISTRAASSEANGLTFTTCNRETISFVHHGRIAGDEVWNLVLPCHG